MTLVDPRYEAPLRQFDRLVLDSSADSVVGVWPDLAIAYCNDGWGAFAERNGAKDLIQRDWSLGRRLTDAVSGPLRAFYLEHYQAALVSTAPWHHDYECSSPAEFRRFHSIAYPLKDRAGLLIVHALVEQRPHGEDGLAIATFDPSLYTDEHGTVHQCGHCRRIARLGETDRWDWVPAWVAQCPPTTSHGLCNLCLDYYYPA